LGHLGGLRRAHRHDLVDRLAVERDADREAGGRGAAADFGDGARGEVRVARVLALGRETEKDVLAHREAAALDARLHFFFRGAGIGGALERDQLSGAQVRHDRFDRADDEAEIGLARRAERRRHADDERVGLGQARYVVRRLEPAAARRGDRVVRNMQEIALAGVQRHRLGLVDVEADDGEARLREAQRERQPDVAQTDHPYARGARAATLEELRGEAAELALRELQWSSLCRTSTMRSAARPSHSSGRRPRLPSPRRTRATAAAIRAGSVPASALVPSSTVSGRSVFSRQVTHGTPSAVVSSCSPPESVRVKVASFQRLRNSMYESGGVRQTPGPRSAACPFSLARVRGWTGKISGSSRETSPSARTRRASVAGSSTLEARCSVTTPYRWKRFFRSEDPRLAVPRRSVWYTRLSTMTWPTWKMRSQALPSRTRLSTAAGSVTKKKSEIESVTMRLISSGIARSRLRSPASTCATGMPAFLATMAQASVELTSPTTITRSARRLRQCASKASMIFAVCSACEPLPASKQTSGRGSPSSSKKTSFISRS